MIRLAVAAIAGYLYGRRRNRSRRDAWPHDYGGRAGWPEREDPSLEAWTQ